MDQPFNIISFVISDVCNQKCLFCSGAGNQKSNSLFAEPDVFRKLNWLKAFKNIVLVGSGEALTNPHYPEIIKNVYHSSPSSNIILYTNGLGLTGKALDATLKYASSVFISQNSLVKSTYESFIKGGNFEQSIENLEQLSRNKDPKLFVKLMMVCLRQNTDEVSLFIDTAARLKFQRIKLMLGFPPAHHLLPEDSYFQSWDECIDAPTLDKYAQYAQERNVEFETNASSRAGLSGLCSCPWNELYLNYRGGGTWNINVCCRGATNLTITNDKLHDFESFWQHSRLDFIRATVNDPDTLPANKMCSSCRLRIRDEKLYNDTLAKQKRFQPKYGSSHFEEILICNESCHNTPTQAEERLPSPPL